MVWVATDCDISAANHRQKRTWNLDVMLGEASAASSFTWDGAASGFTWDGAESSFTWDQYGDGAPMAAKPQVQWWNYKFTELDDSKTGYKLRAVGNMKPTNLGPTQPKGMRNKAREQRVKHQQDQEAPKVPMPMRAPSDIALAMTLEKLQQRNVPGVCEVQQNVCDSFERAYQAVVSAARAHEDLCTRTQKLLRDPKTTHTIETIKNAKIQTRDVLFWRWSGLTAWIYNQAESEFFQFYGREMESQLMNCVSKNRQRLLQDLMQSSAWERLEAEIVRRAATGTLEGQLKGLLKRFHYILHHLGGPKHPVLNEFAVLRDSPKSLQEIALEQERALAQEDAFADEVWNLQNQRVATSMIDFLSLDDPDDFEDHFEYNLEGNFENNHDDNDNESEIASEEEESPYEEEVAQVNEVWSDQGQWSLAFALALDHDEHRGFHPGTNPDTAWENCKAMAHCLQKKTHHVTSCYIIVSSCTCLDMFVYVCICNIMQYNVMLIPARCFVGLQVLSESEEASRAELECKLEDKAHPPIEYRLVIVGLILWYIMIYYDILWYIMIYYDILWYNMI